MQYPQTLGGEYHSRARKDATVSCQWVLLGDDVQHGVIALLACCKSVLWRCDLVCDRITRFLIPPTMMEHVGEDCQNTLGHLSATGEKHRKRALCRIPFSHRAECMNIETSSTTLHRDTV